MAVAFWPGVLFAESDEVLIAVAANFTAATQRIVPLFEASSGHRVRVSFGSTGKLYAQIRNGAPFDAFLAADQVRPELLEEEGVSVPGSRFTYATGRLALWSADAGLVDPEGAVLSSDRIERLAIANPKTAPYGAAALEILQRLGIAARLRPRLVQGESISQTFQFVSTGNATLGFIALSQLRGLPEPRGSAWIVPQHLYTPIRQDAILLERATDNTAARDWLSFLRGPEARRVIEQLGYGVD
jgi:molybdate transport system substrate-binding protein